VGLVVYFSVNSPFSLSVISVTLSALFRSWHKIPLVAIKKKHSLSSYFVSFLEEKSFIRARFVYILCRVIFSVCVCRKARSLDADLHVISTSLKSVEISEQMVCSPLDFYMDCRACRLSTAGYGSCDRFINTRFYFNFSDWR